MDPEVEKYVFKLRDKLKDTENDLHLSAKHGKGLLDENIRLKDTLNKSTTSSEVLEQERYTLRIKLEAARKNEEGLREELEFVREETTKVKHEKETILAENSRLTQRINKLVSELNEKVVNETELQSALNKLESKLKKDAKSDEFECKLKAYTYTEEDDLVNSLQKEVEELQGRQKTLLELIDEKETKLEESQKTITAVHNKAEMLERELETKECQVTSHFNLLERYREEILELKTEMQILQMSEVDPNRRGNSLFSEVEDHRQRLEKHLNSLRTRYDALHTQNEENLKHIHTLNLIVAGYAAAIGPGINVAHVEMLERNVAKLQSEIRVLMARQEKRVKCVEFGADHNGEDGEYGYLKAMINQVQSHCEELETECKSLQFKRMSESDQSRKVRRQLIEMEQRAEALRTENVRLRVKLDELQPTYGIESGVVKVVEKIEFEANDDDKKTNLVKSVKLDALKKKEHRPQRVRFSSSVSNLDGEAFASGDTCSVAVPKPQPNEKSAKKPLKVITAIEEDCQIQ